MPEIRLPDLGEAEGQLLELIRLRDAQSFTLSISCVDGGWTVTNPTSEAPSSTIGHGATFEEDWFRQDPAAVHRRRLPSRTLYESSNGDTWHLITVGGGPIVRHVPNAHSGGRTSEVPVGAFLSASHHGPEHAELLRLIAALIADKAER